MAYFNVLLLFRILFLPVFFLKFPLLKGLCSLFITCEEDELDNNNLLYSLKPYLCMGEAIFFHYICKFCFLALQCCTMVFPTLGKVMGFLYSPSPAVHIHLSLSSMLLLPAVGSDENTHSFRWLSPWYCYVLERTL